MTPTPPPGKEPKEFRFQVWPFYRLETKGYTSEENNSLVKSTTSLRRLWLIVICVLILLVYITFGESIKSTLPGF